MLRYCYILNLLICINIGFCYEYTSNLDSNKRAIRRESNLQRKHHKRHDYDMLDKDPVAEIDVASFINTSEDGSISENDPYDLHYKRLQNRKQDNYYDSLANDMTNNNEDYSDLEEENLQEFSHNNNDPFSKDKKITNKFIRGFDDIPQGISDNNIMKHNKNNHKEKKCVLKHIKLPFFSHNKSTVAEAKKNKRRKINVFHNSRNENVNRKSSNKDMIKDDKSRDTSNISKHDNIKKRSYFERFCPACRRKFMIKNKKPSRSQTKRINTYLNYEEYSRNNQKHPNKDDVDAITPKPNEKYSIDNSWSDRRRKREDDDRNIERQKEIEYLEKRVESVTVNSPSNNAIKL